MPPTEREIACFEAGIKFGSLYHQFVGTPVSAESAQSLERAIERAIENQPYCTNVTVQIRTDALETTHGYTELTGRYMEAALTVEYKDTTVEARMALEDDYPLMRITAVNAD